MPRYDNNFLDANSARQLYGTYWRVGIAHPSSTQYLHARVTECLGRPIYDSDFADKQDAIRFAQSECKKIKDEELQYIKELKNSKNEKTDVLINHIESEERVWRQQPSSPKVEQTNLEQKFNEGAIAIENLPITAVSKEVLILVEDAYGEQKLIHHQLKGFEVKYHSHDGSTCAQYALIPQESSTQTEPQDAELELLSGGTYMYRTSEERSPYGGVEITPDHIFTSVNQVLAYAGRLQNKAEQLTNLVENLPSSEVDRHNEFAP